MGLRGSTRFPTTPFLHPPSEYKTSLWQPPNYNQTFIFTFVHILTVHLSLLAVNCQLLTGLTRWFVNSGDFERGVAQKNSYTKGVAYLGIHTR